MQPGQRSAKGRPGKFLSSVLQWGTDGIVLLLVIFSPLAFGGVQPWAVAAIEWGALLAFSLWILRRIWRRNEARRNSGLCRWALRPLERAGVKAIVFAFLGLVVLQLVPLPPAILQTISPNTFRLYRQTLPYYGEQGGIDFARMEEWLSGEPEAQVNPQEDELPWSSRRDPELRFSNLRTLSLVPSLTMRNLGIFIAYLLIFLVVADRSRDRRFRWLLLWTIALTGVLVAVLGLIQQTTWGDLIYGQIRPAYGGSPMGPFVNRNHFAGYLELSILVLLGLAIGVARREANRSKRLWTVLEYARAHQQYIPQLFMISVLVLVGGLSLWRSGSRGGLISLGVTFLVIGAILALISTGASGRKRLLWLGVILAVAVGIAWKVHVLTGEESLESELLSEPSFGKRVWVWKDSLRMLERFAGLGTGLGTYGQVIPLHQSGGFDRLWIYAHNDYIQLACETGVLGFLLLAIGLLQYGSRVLAPVVRNPSQHSGVELGCIAGMLSILIHSLVDFNLQIPSNGLLFVILGAVLIGFKFRSSTNEMAADADTLNTVSGRNPLAASTVVGLVFLVGTVPIFMAGGSSILQSRATQQFWSGELGKARRNIERALLIGWWQLSLPADAGFFYIRSLDEFTDAERVLGISRTEALERARRSIYKAINRNPGGTTTWSGLAELYRVAQAEQLRKRVLDLGDLLDATPGDAPLERLYMTVLRKMMGMELRNPYYRVRLGDFLWERADRKGALRAYQDAVRLMPKPDELPFLSGGETESEILEAAIAGVTQALAEDRQEFPAHRLQFNLSELYRRAGDVESAILHMQRARDLLPDYEYYGRKLGYLLFRAGQFDRSRELLLYSLDHGGQSSYIYLSLARIAREKGELSEAEAYYRNFLGLDPENGRVAVELARLYETMNDDRGARRYFEFALEVAPEELNVLVAVSEYYTREGRFSGSIAVLQKIIELRPSDDIYKKRLQQIRQKAVSLR